MPYKMLPEDWEERMKPYPCYRPAVPFYDVCLNMNKVVKKLDCENCIEKNDIVDFIE